MSRNPMASTWWLDGQRCLSMSPDERGFLYGDGLFSTMRVRQGMIGLWPHHLHRLQEGALRLGLAVDLTGLEYWLKQMAERVGDGTLKVIISRGKGLRGYLPPVQPARCYVQMMPVITTLRDCDPDGLHGALPIDSGVLQGCLGHQAPMLAGLKTLNRLEQVLLRQVLAQTVWPEALVVDLDGMLVEGVQSNCFLLMDGVWQTPDLSKAGITGVMRAEILHRMADREIDCRISRVPVALIDRIEALFFCNALTGMVPVAQLAGRALNLSAVDSLLADLLS
jgi:4-amino-4-deoxychorismate lyase